MSERTATVSDLPGLVALEDSFAAAERWNRQLWSDELAAGDRLVLVTGPVGVGVELTGAATFQLVGDTADLHRVVVAAGHRRHGLARSLVGAGLRWAGEQGATRVLLEVRHDNEPAVALYRSLGFVVIGERRDYYAAGAHALVMELVLAGLDPDAVDATETEVAR